MSDVKELSDCHFKNMLSDEKVLVAFLIFRAGGSINVAKAELQEFLKNSFAGYLRCEKKGDTATIKLNSFDSEEEFIADMVTKLDNANVTMSEGIREMVDGMKKPKVH